MRHTPPATPRHSGNLMPRAKADLLPTAPAASDEPRLLRRRVAVLEFLLMAPAELRRGRSTLAASR